MKVLFVTGSPYEDYKGQILHLHVKQEEGEKIRVGEKVSIEMISGMVTCV